MSVRQIVLQLWDEKCPSRNQDYAGRHWSKRSSAASRIHQLVRSALDPDVLLPFSGRVDIEVIAYYNDKRRHDPDNVWAKPYVDGLVGWLIEDDNDKHVRRVTTEVRRGPVRVEIIITPVESEGATWEK